MTHCSLHHAVLVAVLAVPTGACTMESSADTKVSAPACQTIEVSLADRHPDATAQELATAVRDVLRAACVEDHWDARAIACYAALGRHVPVPESERDRCTAMLTPAQAARVKRRSEDFFFGPGRTAESVQRDIEAATPATPALQLAALVGTWTYKDPDRMEGTTRIQIAADGSFYWLYAPAHDGGCEIKGRATTAASPDPKVLGTLSVATALDSCRDAKVRTWSVRALTGSKLTLRDEVETGSKPRVFRRQ